MNEKKRRQKQKNHNKKRKPKVTNEFLDTESEVSNLLQKIDVNPVTTTKDKTQSEIDFFANPEGDTVAADLLAPSLERSEENNRKSSIHSNESRESAEKTTPSKKNIQESVRPVATFIQIEDSSPIRRQNKEKIRFEDNEFYWPAADSKNLGVLERADSFSEDGVYRESAVVERDKNVLRMVNRLNEEGKYSLISPSKYIQNQQQFSVDKNLYRTEDVEKEFTPFCYVVPLSDIQRELLTAKKLLTLTINELKFTEHMLQSEEHHLANQLENTFAEYQEIIEENKIKKTKLELQNLRETLKYFLENSNEDEHFDKIESYTKQIKILRKKLHREELHFKSTLQNALNQWLLLKNCRKNQGYNYTDFKLVIQLEDVDGEEDEQKWQNRFQVELNEVLREKFEKYYKDKRLRKSRKLSDETRKAPLVKPDVDKIRTEVESNLRACTRDIAEPKIKLFRRKLEDHCKNLDKFKDYFLQIMFDNELVGATKHFRLSSDFLIQINQSFGVYLETNMPKTIKIKIFEKSKLASPEKLCVCYLPLQPTIDYSSGCMELIDFSSNRRNDKISGVLKATIFCETELHSENSNFLFNSQSKSKVSKEILKSWCENNLIDPLDPDCISLFNQLTLNHEENMVAKEKTYDDGNFVLNDELLTFCSKEEIDNNPRFNMLRSRYHKEMKYKNTKFIPLYENEIEEDEIDDKVLDVGNWMDEIDLLRYKGRKYIQKMYGIILNHCIQLNIDRDNSNLLIGDQVPTIQSVIDSIRDIFGPSRPLNPTKTSQSVSQYSSRAEIYNIVINIARATGIPVRNLNTSTLRRSSSVSTENEKQNLKYGNVRPYVCVTYNDKVIRTMTAEGSNPTWNEELILQINESRDNLKSDLIIQIFDECVEDLMDEDNIRSMEVYQRIHANWLGEYRVPIRTILDKQKIEGSFEIKLPKLIVGYSKATIDLNEYDETVANDFLEIRNSVFIWIYINLEPKFDSNVIDKSPLQCSELRDIKTQIYEWCIQVKELMPSRFLDPLICTEAGKRICMTRLLECIPLPFDEQIENVESLIRHYVSLIPVLKNESDCLSLQGVWLSNQTILDTTWASPKDLGVLLACYYMTLGIRAWLVLGISFPYGETTYVLTHEDNMYILSDPNTGKQYEIKDTQCPLNKILYLVGQENIYCNLQREQRVSMTDFNISDSSLWLPLFTKSKPAPIGGFHNIKYKYKNSFNILELRKNIERKIIKKISSWRTNRKTIWNRAFTDVMNEILSNLEHDIVTETIPQNYIEKLIKEIPNFKIYGFTLNFPYANLTTISKQIRSTGIHLNADNDIEFSVSVHIQQYPNNILSCWIFLLTLTPLRQHLAIA